jgi:hypothetical protein
MSDFDMILSTELTLGKFLGHFLVTEFEFYYSNSKLSKIAMKFFTQCKKVGHVCKFILGYMIYERFWV